jgi:hypothetical protein
MRLWTLNPKYLDPKGLVALWRETLLAQKVLRNETRGYRHHPQLTRFRSQPDPLAAIAAYLRIIAEEGARRGYRFDTGRIGAGTVVGQIIETEGQLRYEQCLLFHKLAQRALPWLQQMPQDRLLEAHPLFAIVPGDIQPWERVKPLPGSA